MDSTLVSRCLAVALLCGASAFAQTTWSDARVAEVALRRSPAVREARAALGVATAGRAHGERPIVGNPAIGVLVLPGFPDFGAWTTGVSVGLPLEVSGLRGAWAREAEQGIRSAQAHLDDETLRAVTGARAARVEVALAQAQVNVQRARLAAADEALARTRARVDARASTAVELGLAEQEQAEAAADLAHAQTRETQALGAFRSALDLDATEVVAVDAAGRPTPITPEEAAAATAHAVRVRGDALAFDAQAARLDLSTSRLARGAVAPLVVGFEAQQVAVAPQELGASIGASLRWEVPLVQRAQGDRALAEAEARAARTQASLLRRQIARDVLLSAETLARCLVELDALEARAIPAAERLVAASEAAFAAGALDYFRVLTARREVLTLRARALDVLETAWSARFAFDRARGDVDAR